jgi:predicted flap endonuclease-1-like 5' DNA nuclease
MQADANRTPDRIDALPGLGPKSRDMLAAAGITTPAQMGSVRA